MYVYRNTAARSRNHCCRGKAISIITDLCARTSGYPGAWVCACEYVNVALLIPHATCKRHIVTSFVAPQDPQYFSTLSHK